jgi:1-acyl-sn-glycerol-3-phosphate acyltransferase
VRKRKIIFYTDERNDEFSRAQITPRTVDASYVYDHDSVWKRFTHFFWYRIVATPIAFLYTKLVFGHRVVNHDLLRTYAGKGCFLYGNHTQDIADAFIPNLLRISTETSVIVHPNNVSMPILGRITPSLGALPLPDDMGAYRHFLEAIERRIRAGNQIVIYPEAHIWPYYTEIRSFSDDSFLYPVKYGVAAFCFTNVYRRRRWGRRPRIVTYIDGPFYPREDLPMRERRRDLRDRVYACMCERAKMSDVRWIQYIKKEKTDG